jgi:hypothetical protein
VVTVRSNSAFTEVATTEEQLCEKCYCDSVDILLNNSLDLSEG